MSGLFALLTKTIDDGLLEKSRRLMADMQLFSWQTADMVVRAGGRVALGVVIDKEKKRPSGTELFSKGRLTAAINGHISRFRETNAAGSQALVGELHAKAVILAYEKYGHRFPEKLEGHYSAIIVDESTDSIIACCSRTAFTPLYEHIGETTHFFCSQLGPMAASGVFDPVADAQAISTLLTYGALFERQTLVEGVNSMEPASVVEIPLGSGSVRRWRYWDFRMRGPIAEGLTLPQHVDTMCDVITAAADRRANDGARVVSGLSGGYDSRLVTGMMAKRIPHLMAWTFGTENAPDISAATEVCRILGIERHFLYQVPPQDVVEFAQDFATTVDGCITTNWAYSKLRKLDLRAHADLALNGFGGDAYLGGSMTGGKYRAVKSWITDRSRGRHTAPAPYLEWNHGARDLAMFIARGNKIASKSEREQWFPPPQCTLEERAFEDLHKSAGNVPEWYLAEQWLWENRVTRFTLMSIVSDRHFFPDDSIFYDYDVLDHCAAIPPSMRRGHRVYIPVLRRLLPHIARVVNSNTGLPASTPQALVTTHKIATRLLEKVMRRTSSHVKDTTALDANFWVRTSLRKFYADLVNDGSTRTRPFWDGTAIVERFNAHQSGVSNFGRELGLIASIELFTRRWIDRMPPM